jgi:hypothetical protein
MATSPYATAATLKRPVPAYVTNPDDIDRIRAYVTYEEIWNNVPAAFEALLRASDDPLARRYVPVVRDLIEAVNRYLGLDMETVWTPLPGATVTDDQMAEWTARVAAFWAREEVGIKFLSNKRWGLIKGDSLLHITADPSKAEGMRVRLTEIQPEEYFPIWDPSDGERIQGCYLVTVVENADGDEIIQRIEYRKVLNEEQASTLGAPVGSVFYRLGFYEMDGWDDRDPDGELKTVDAPDWAAPAEGALDPFAGFGLDPRITTIPVYHIRNRRRGGKPGRFGTSDIQGLESLLAGLIQNTTDEDLAIALVSLGVYWTTSGKSRDSKGNVVPWIIGPASVAELEADAAFGRVEGITTVQPIQDHMSYLTDAARGANGAPKIASGAVDTSVTLSGVAMRIEFAPVLSANAEREEEMASKWGHILFDLLNMWFPVYEGWQPLPLQPSVEFGDPLPPDREKIIAEITTLVTAGIISKEFAVTRLNEALGYKIPVGDLAIASSEQAAALDAEAAQIAANAGQVVDGGDPAA